ncbi:hypothetical protein [Leifsonia poae]|uniref:hypothetical protein n=1 Tax=Leifsonia poae TaxID=110933 RepID=UPI001CBE92D6|nr:hypothetical protein [Leifsonia poae]
MRHIRLAGLLVATSATAIALSGCSVIAAFTPHVDSDIFDTAKELTPSVTAAFGSPAFIPADATIIRVDYDTEGTGAILTYTSKTHFAAGTCTKTTSIPKPSVQDSWWPVDGMPKEAQSCPGGWAAFAIGDQVYASVAKN